MDIRKITDDIAVAPQINAGDVKDIAASGYRTIMNNRPDGEAMGQPENAEIEAAAKAAGLNYVYLPVVSGRMTEEDVANFGKVLKEAEGPVLAFCRTGTRCTNLWALAKAGELPAVDIVEKAGAAGYDLNGLKPVLEARAGSKG